MSSISRARYAGLYGPTTGDKIRLADTELLVEIERDYTIYGEESSYGLGKSIRAGMAQSSYSAANGAAEAVITNVVIVDHWGVLKADIGIIDGRISAIGKSGNPDLQPGVNIIIGPGTQVIDGSGKILTAGTIAMDVPISSGDVLMAMAAAGTTTVIGGGSGPVTGSRVTGATPGAWTANRLLDSLDAWPLNFVLVGLGSASQPGGLEAQVWAGAVGALNVHDTRGATPAAIDNCLSIADKYDVPVMITSDTANEFGFNEDTIAAFKGRTVILPDVGGVEGGHIPDVIRCAGLPNVIPASSVAALPYTVDLIDGLYGSVMAANNLDPSIPEDVALAESIIHKETIAATDLLHDMGAISIVAGSSVFPEANAEIVRRTWQMAHKMKIQRDPLPGDGSNDNQRVKRYVAKYTINPAIACGIAHVTGSVEPGKLADLVLWDPAYFGTQPALVLKGGVATSDGSGGLLSTDQSIVFISKSSLEMNGITVSLRHRIEAVRDTRGSVGKHSMIHNTSTPVVEIDPETFEVRADGELLTAEPATVLPLGQRYLL
ncbi:urease subunit alpha [Herbaspirillum hiltneri N3]|uniref:Urease subunit alpha n=2 Tax=Herbaspirillum TaxID=963 RepID=A0ABM5V6F1_9BURK|nr:urease subunit alpha [Herbaspirillum hiltneri N3]